MKKIIYIFFIGISYINLAFAAEPHIECDGMPGCSPDSSKGAINFIGHITAELIKYVAVVAVLSLIAAGFMYIFSSGEDEKTKKARKWIFWSLIAVFISISGYFLINLINDASISI